jgi:hypothetical protein
MSQTLLFDLDITRLVSKQRDLLKPNRASFSISDYNEIRGVIPVAVDENTPASYSFTGSESLIYLVVDRPISITAHIDGEDFTFDVNKVFFYTGAVGAVELINEDVDNPVNFLVLYA